MKWMTGTLIHPAEEASVTRFIAAELRRSFKDVIK